MSLLRFRPSFVELAEPERKPASGIIQGDCVAVMQGMAAGAVDMILTDPPYLVSYRDRSGRTLANDNNPAFVRPALSQMGRVLTQDGVCILFCGWAALHHFAPAWTAAGFAVKGQLVFVKPYASSARTVACRHESAFVLSKGAPKRIGRALPDVLPWHYSGNRLHPTEKAVNTLLPSSRPSAPKAAWCSIPSAAQAPLSPPLSHAVAKAWASTSIRSM